MIATDEDRFIPAKMVESLLAEVTSYFLSAYLSFFRKAPINLRSQISKPIKHSPHQTQALVILEQSDAQPNLLLNQNPCPYQSSLTQQALQRMDRLIAYTSPTSKNLICSQWIAHLLPRHSFPPHSNTIAEGKTPSIGVQQAEGP